eukprot:6213840-Pleurochrysis_carterae.AAC.3
MAVTLVAAQAMHHITRNEIAPWPSCLQHTDLRVSGDATPPTSATDGASLSPTRAPAVSSCTPQTAPWSVPSNHCRHQSVIFDWPHACIRTFKYETSPNESTRFRFRGAFSGFFPHRSQRAAIRFSPTMAPTAHPARARHRPPRCMPRLLRLLALCNGVEVTALQQAAGVTHARFAMGWTKVGSQSPPGTVHSRAMSPVPENCLAAAEGYRRVQRPISLCARLPGGEWPSDAAKSMLLKFGGAGTPKEEKEEMLRTLQELDPVARAEQLDAALRVLDGLAATNRWAMRRWPLRLPSKRVAL